MANPNNYLTGQTLVDKVRTISSVDEFDNDRNKGLEPQSTYLDCFIKIKNRSNTKR